MSIFKFKHFEVKQSEAAMKVGTDAMLLGAMIQAENAQLALDVGSGTGVVSLMVAQNCLAQIDAVELDLLSFKESQLNFENSPWKGRLEAHHYDFIHFETNKRYDLIFSNPPYYQTQLENDNRREAQAKHESSLPMLSFINKLNDVLSDSGEVWLIIPFLDANIWIAEFEKKEIKLNEVIEIRGKRKDQPNRSILKLSRKKSDIRIKPFVVREDNGKYSPEYIALTKEFHANKLG